MCRSKAILAVRATLALVAARQGGAGAHACACADWCWPQEVEKPDRGTATPTGKEDRMRGSAQARGTHSAEAGATIAGDSSVPAGGASPADGGGSSGASSGRHHVDAGAAEGDDDAFSTTTTSEDESELSAEDPVVDACAADVAPPVGALAAEGQNQRRAIPGTADWFYNQAIDAEARETTDWEATALYRKALQIDLKHASSLNNMGVRMSRTNDRNVLAEALFRRALQADPRHVCALFNLARHVAVHNSAVEEASVLVSRGLEVHPGNADLHDLGVLLDMGVFGPKS